MQTETSVSVNTIKIRQVRSSINSMNFGGDGRHNSTLPIKATLPYSLRDGPLEKLWGGGGGGIFEPQEFFFVTKFRV